MKDRKSKEINLVKLLEFEEVLKRMGSTKKLLTINKKQLKFIRYTSRESLENLTFAGHIKGKRSRRKTIIYQDILWKIMIGSQRRSIW